MQQNVDGTKGATVADTLLGMVLIVLAEMVAASLLHLRRTTFLTDSWTSLYCRCRHRRSDPFRVQREFRRAEIAPELIPSSTHDFSVFPQVVVEDYLMTSAPTKLNFIKIVGSFFM
jgi:hypothetical protein